MKLARPKPEQWHNNYEEGNHFKKGFWKRRDRKKFIRNFIKQLTEEK